MTETPCPRCGENTPNPDMCNDCAGELAPELAQEMEEALEDAEDGDVVGVFIGDSDD